jgi:hypothetical protein
MLDSYPLTPIHRTSAPPRPLAPDDGALALLRGAISLSGLSARSFAETVLVRDERTVRRWIAGDTPIPSVLRHWLREYLADRRELPTPHTNSG